MNAPCECCRGTGLVSVFSPWTVAGLATGRESITACGRTVRTYSADGRVNWQKEVCVPCKCHLGDAQVMRYDRTANVRPWNDGQEKQARCQDKWWHVRVPDPKADRTDEQLIDYILDEAKRGQAMHHKAPADNEFNAALGDF